MIPTRIDIRIFRILNSPAQTMAITAAVIVQPRRNRSIEGTKYDAKVAAALASAPVAIAPAASCPRNTGHNTQFLGPGVRLIMSIIPSPVVTVYKAPASPIQYLMKMERSGTHRMANPRIAPDRGARITSPEPMYSAHHTIPGPTATSRANPAGGVRMGAIASDIFQTCGEDNQSRTREEGAIFKTSRGSSTRVRRLGGSFTRVPGGCGSMASPPAGAHAPGYLGSTPPGVWEPHRETGEPPARPACCSLLRAW
jgi:hypothetical protein